MQITSPLTPSTPSSVNSKRSSAYITQDPWHPRGILLPRSPTKEHCAKEHALVPWLNLLSWHGFESLHNLGHTPWLVPAEGRFVFFFIFKKFYFIYLFGHTIQHTGSQFPDQGSFLNMKTLLPHSGHCILSIHKAKDDTHGLFSDAHHS